MTRPAAIARAIARALDTAELRRLLRPTLWQRLAAAWERFWSRD